MLSYLRSMELTDVSIDAVVTLADEAGIDASACARKFSRRLNTNKMVFITEVLVSTKVL